MTQKFTLDEITQASHKLGVDWHIIENKKLMLKRKFKGFNAACHHANLAAFVSEALNHHADISFGWGYCHVIITTHDVGGLSQLDFDFAAQFDAACTRQSSA